MALTPEEAILGAVFIEPDAASTAIAEGLLPRHFASLRDRSVWKAILDIQSRGDAIDPLVVAQHPATHDSVDILYLSALSDSLPDPDKIQTYVRLCIGSSVRRDLGDLARRIESLSKSDLPTEEVLERINTHVSKINESNQGDSHIHSVGDSVQQLIDEIDHPGEDIIKTGYPIFDMLCGGWRPGHLAVLAGRPGMGKTTLAINMAHIQCTRYAKRVGFFSLEMGHTELTGKILSAETQLPLSKIRLGALSDTERDLVAKAQSDISDYGLWIEDSGGLRPEQLAAHTRNLQRTHSLDIVYVDYLQLMESSQGHNRTEEVSKISRALKKLAKELHIPIVALSQLNRSVEYRTDKRPMLADLRESGSIEQDADTVSFVYRPGVYEIPDTTQGRTELILAKNRHGQTGSVPLVFRPQTNQFLNPSP